MFYVRDIGRKLVEKNIRLDRYIRLIEYVRGLYRYPKRMIGRKIDLNLEKSTDVLVIAAHPDDEILGLGTKLHRHRLDGDKVVVAYVTNGTAGEGASWKKNSRTSLDISRLRYNEGIRALSLINVSEDNTICFGYPDLGTHRYLNNIAIDVKMLINSLCPKLIYVHCVEGGHTDHDITSFVVKSVCKKLGFSNLFEWTEYNPLQPLGTKNVNFANSRLTNTEEIMIEISDNERSLKREMLNCHNSQGVVEHFFMGEAIRQARLDDLVEELLNYSVFPEKRIKPLLVSFNKFINVSISSKQKKSCRSHENTNRIGV